MTPPAESSGTPLAAKLGIRAQSRVLVAAAPRGWALPDAPPTAVVHTRLAAPTAAAYDVILLFCPDRAALRRFDQLVERLAAAGALWVAWPKQASGVVTDLTEAGVRQHGLAAGLVDVKIAAVDATWSGLKFVRRVADR